MDLSAAVTPPLERPVFDRSAFDHLTGGDRGLQQELVSLYLAGSGAMEAEIGAAAEADGCGFADALHRVRSSVCFVAAHRLQDRLMTLEQGAVASSSADRAAAAADLGAAMRELRAALVEFLARG